MATDQTELDQMKQALGLTFQGMDRSLAALDMVSVELGRARADCAQGAAIAAAIFNGPGPRASLTRSAFRDQAMTSEDPRFLKAVLLDAWKKSDWAYQALAEQSAGGQG